MLNFLFNKVYYDRFIILEKVIIEVIVSIHFIFVNFSVRNSYI